MKSTNSNPTNLQIVIGDDLDEAIAQPRDLHALGDAVDELDGIHVSANVLEQTRHEDGVLHAVRDQVLPQLVVVMCLHEFDRLRELSCIIVFVSGDEWLYGSNNKS